MTEMPSLLPPFLILYHIPLHLLHVLSEVLAEFHLAHVVSLLLLLPLPGHALLLVFLLALEELARFQLTLTVTVQGLMLLVVALVVGLVEPVSDLLTLIL